MDVPVLFFNKPNSCPRPYSSSR